MSLRPADPFLQDILLHKENSNQNHIFRIVFLTMYLDHKIRETGVGDNRKKSLSQKPRFPLPNNHFLKKFLFKNKPCFPPIFFPHRVTNAHILVTVESEPRTMRQKCQHTRKKPQCELKIEMSAHISRAHQKNIRCHTQTQTHTET